MWCHKDTEEQKKMNFWLLRTEYCHLTIQFADTQLSCAHFEHCHFLQICQQCIRPSDLMAIYPFHNHDNASGTTVSLYLVICIGNTTRQCQCSVDLSRASWIQGSTHIQSLIIRSSFPFVLLWLTMDWWCHNGLMMSQWVH